MTNKEKFLAGKKFTVNGDLLNRVFFFKPDPTGKIPDFGFIRQVEVNGVSFTGSVYHCAAMDVSDNRITIFETILTVRVSKHFAFKNLTFIDNENGK